MADGGEIMWLFILIMDLMLLYLNIIRIMKNIRDNKSTYWNALLGCGLIAGMVFSFMFAVM